MKVPRHDLGPLVSELRTLREKGLLRLRHHPFPALTRAGKALGMPVDQLLERVVSGLDGQLADATAYTLGTAAGTRDWAAQDRRRRAASLYGVTPERFRKQQEILILENVAQEILNLLATSQPTDVVVGASLPLRVGDAWVTVHRRSAESLCDIDVITSSENIYLEMSKSYKSSLSACLRKAAAVRDDAGTVVDDVLPRELREWLHTHGGEGGAVAAGTVVPTSSGEMRHQGVRQIYHAAVVSPREGGNAYDVEPSAVMRAVRNVFALARQNDVHSVCLPLFGAGRGGLDPEVAFSQLWPQLARELAGPCEIHLVARSDRGIAAILTGLHHANDSHADL